jgi:hypothetical protein
MESEMATVICQIGGNCPVQAEGTIDGSEFYFRARGERWSIGIGSEPVGDPEWYYEEPYGSEPFAAGWMTVEEASAFIEQAADRYRNRPSPDDDGQPDEQQEWRDFDEYC